VNGASSAMLLQAEGAPGGPDFSFFIMMGAIFLIFYMLVMRPQQKTQRERDDAIKAAVKGDKVVTAGGLHGTVTAVTDDTLTVEIARVKGGARVEVEVARARIDSINKATDSTKKEGGDSA
jgi:preprotein translocase subunit YajC